jgi:hypothetical protein
VVTKLT